jgi:aryl-alcohol dehydrogenase-like predicted oxidoreductase
MNYNFLGRSDLRVSEISFGCMSLGSDHVENKVLLHEAFSKGINFFDTADLYSKGDNEVTVGNAFRGMRDKVILATKVGNQLRPDGSGWDWNPSAKYILQAVEKSLERLQTDYIDLYQLHGGTIDDPIDETIGAFELLKQQGKIRAYGISSIRPNVILEYVRRSSIDSVMMQYSLLDRRPEESCFDLLHRNKISLLVRGSLAQGLLVNKPTAPYLNQTIEEVEKTINAASSLKPRASEEVAIRFALHPTAVASVVIGVRHEEQLTKLLKVVHSPSLQKDEIDYLLRESKAIQYEQHR